jgi:hypothetical protein
VLPQQCTPSALWHRMPVYDGHWCARTQAARSVLQGTTTRPACDLSSLSPRSSVLSLVSLTLPAAGWLLASRVAWPYRPGCPCPLSFARERARARVGVPPDARNSSALPSNRALVLSRRDQRDDEQPSQ